MRVVHAWFSLLLSPVLLRTHPAANLPAARPSLATYLSQHSRASRALLPGCAHPDACAARHSLCPPRRPRSMSSGGRPLLRHYRRRGRRMDSVFCNNRRSLAAAVAGGQRRRRQASSAADADHHGGRHCFRGASQTAVSKPCQWCGQRQQTAAHAQRNSLARPARANQSSSGIC